jgi:hypothetical protein
MKAHDFPETQGHGPRVEEVSGSCPWWRRAWARRAAGSSPRARLDHCPDRGHGAGSRLTGSGMGLQPGTGSHIKRLVSEVNSYLWAAALAARSRTSAAGRTPGTAVGPTWGPAAVAGGERLGSAHMQRRQSQNVTGPRSQSGGLETGPRLWPEPGRDPAFPLDLVRPFLQPAEVPCLRPNLPALFGEDLSSGLEVI